MMIMERKPGNFRPESLRRQMERTIAGAIE